MTILTVFFDPVVPVFAIMAVGFVMGRTGAVTIEAARHINRLAMMVFVPVVVFGLTAKADVRSFALAPILIYAAVEVVLFAGGFTLARKVFGRPPDEAILLAFGSIFANNVFFTLPIALFLYGDGNLLALTAVVTLDATISFGAAAIAMQIISLGHAKPLSVAMSLVRTPLLQAIALGILLNALRVPLPGPVDTFVTFNGAAAAPVALFALGVVLSKTPLVPDRLVLTFGAIKLFVMPALVALGLAVLAPRAAMADQFVLGAAGPAGAMAFSLAMLHGVRTDAIAQLIIWSSVGSLFTLAVLA